MAADLDCPVQQLTSPMFLLDEASVDDYFQGAAKPRMAGFYKAQRQRLQLLMEDGKPMGGKWSFDESNRNKLPKEQSAPNLPAFSISETTRTCLQTVSDLFLRSSRSGDRALAADGSQRRGGLARSHFLEERLIGFGTYEDAISTRSPTLFHSVLSPFLNTGLLTPDEVVARTLDAADEQRVPLNDLEGFPAPGCWLARVHPRRPPTPRRHHAQTQRLGRQPSTGGFLGKRRNRS